MRLAELRQFARAELQSLVVALEPDLASQQLQREIDLLLCHALDMPLTALLVNPEYTLSEKELQLIQELIQRRKQEEPLAYVLGSCGFHEIELAVSPDVLIPRPETELLVERALAILALKHDTLSLIDVGTGSGAIVLAILNGLRGRFGESYLKRIECTAVDVSKRALEVASSNARRLGLASYIEFRQADLFEGLAHSQQGSAQNTTFQLIVSNPPYVPDDEQLPPSVQDFEPELALRAGKQGLEVIYKLISQALVFSTPRARLPARLLVEIGHKQRTAVESRLRKLGLREPVFHKDLQGIDRFVEVSMLTSQQPDESLD